MKKLIVMIFILGIILAQSNDDILVQISQKYDKLEDFQGKMKVLTDVPNFRMPIKTVQLFYKAPDKMKMKVKGFAILPKSGVLPFMYLQKLNRDSIGIDTIYTQVVDKKNMTFVSISDTSVLKSSKVQLTIDNYLERIEQVLITNEQDTISTIDFSYQNIDGFWMPETTEFNFNMNKRLPRASGPSISNPFGGIDIATPEDHFQNNGKVTLIFSNIKLNSGLSDDIFQDAQ